MNSDQLVKYITLNSFSVLQNPALSGHRRVGIKEDITEVRFERGSRKLSIYPPKYF